MTTLDYFPEIFKAMLEARGIGEADREDFLSPRYEGLHDPMLLPDMEKARDRVIRAIRDGEHIVVYSDYDADGIPGAVVLSDFFRRADYGNVSFYIPHRHDEGFGLNKEAVDEIIERGAKLIITVDCGIADVSEVLHANSAGIDTIITDHHEPGQVLPDAYAIVNPRRADSTYPFKDLCGAAVAYKLVQAILSKESFGIKEGMEKWSLDMVGLATLSDCVPLVGENRILARYGLAVMRKSPRPGLRALLNKLNINQKFLNEDDIAFMITPRINAASRMGVPKDAFDLLSTEDETDALRLVMHLEDINNERKVSVANLVKEAKHSISNRETVREVIVVGNPEWRPALAGLVANSLVEEYERPVFVWGRDGDGVLKGSCRSYGGCNLFELMGEAREMFLEFGGHSGAGGFSVELGKLPLLEEELSSKLAIFSRRHRVSTSDEGPTFSITVNEISEKLWETISTFAPFGTGNPKPILKIQGEVKSVRSFGKVGNHLELTLSDVGSDVKAVSFFSTPSSYSVPLEPNVRVSLLANLEKSYFRSRPELRLRIVDIT